jgi:hypothetical protein
LPQRSTVEDRYRTKPNKRPENKIFRPLQRDLLLKMPNKTQTKHQKKKTCQETAQMDDGRSHTETIEKWFTKTKEKGRRRRETHQG